MNQVIEEFLNRGHHDVIVEGKSYSGQDYDDVSRVFLAEHLGLTEDDISDTNGCEFEIDRIINENTGEVEITYEPFQTEFNDTLMIETAKIKCLGKILNDYSIQINSVCVVSYEEG